MLKPSASSGAAMVSDLDILRSARVVLDHHRQNALIHAAKRADEMLERVNVVGDTGRAGSG